MIVDFHKREDTHHVGVLLTREEFVTGEYTDSSGHGWLSTHDMVSDIVVFVSDAQSLVWPDWATHVLWEEQEYAT